MAFIYDTAFDAAIAVVITNGTALSLCSQEPTSYAEVGTYGLAKDTSVTCGAVANGASNGRRTVVPICDCVGSAGGSAPFWALHNNSNTLVSTGALPSAVTIVNGLTYTTAAFSITIADAT
jgi:hypothetical protein